MTSANWFAQWFKSAEEEKEKLRAEAELDGREYVSYEQSKFNEYDMLARIKEVKE